MAVLKVKALESRLTGTNLGEFANLWSCQAGNPTRATLETSLKSYRSFILMQSFLSVRAWSWFDCYSFCTLPTDSFCQWIIWCWTIITADWAEVSVITEEKICWMETPSNLYSNSKNKICYGNTRNPRNIILNNWDSKNFCKTLFA